jgi:hypothetical protein
VIGAPWFKRLSYRGDNGTVAGPATGTQLRPGNLSHKRIGGQRHSQLKVRIYKGIGLRTDDEEPVESGDG